MKKILITGCSGYIGSHLSKMLANDYECKKSNTNTAKICNETTIKHVDFISDLNRSIICIDDVRSILTNKHKFRVIYTDDDTYLTKDPSFEPEEETEGLSLFEGL